MKKLTLLFTLSFLLLAGMRLQAQDTIPALNYSSSSGVDPDATFKHLTSIDDGDWMEYSMYTSEETEYLLFFNILNSNPGYGAIEIVIDGGVVDTMYLPNTYGMWNNAVPAPIFIAAGNHTLRLNVLEGGWDFNHLAFNSYMGSGGNLYVPGQIDAEDYADMYRAGVGICEETVNINMLEFGTSYTDYFVDVWEAGNYLINVRYANGNAGTAYIDFYLDETYLTAVNTAYTGDWCTFTIATTEDSVFLSEGFYTLRVYSYGGDIDWINISKDDLSETPSGTSWYDVESNWIIGNIDGASQTIDGIIATSYDNGGYGNWAQWDAQYSLNQQENILNISYKRTEGDNSYGSFAFVLGEAENNGGDNTRISDDTYYGNLINMDYNPLIKVKIKSENTMTLQFTLTDVNGRNNNGNVINIQVDASTEWIEYVWDFSMTSNVNKYHPYFWNQYNGRDTWADPSVEIPIDLSQIAQIQVMVNPGVVENNFINFQMTDLQIGTTGGGGINLDPIYDFDGNEYNVVQIGDQVWMASNLRTTSFNDGSSILMLTDNTEWEMVTGPAYCWYENDQATYGDIYGALYNGYAVLNENLCPTGWKIATYDDWMVLENYLTGQGYNSGTALKDDVNWDGTNDFGFSAQPGSARDYNGTWQGAIGSYGQYWTPTAETGENLWYKMFETGFADIGSYTGGKNIGFSVRCIKGENTGNITIPAHIEAESYIEQFITVQFSTEEGKNQGIEYTGNQSYTKYNINVPISGEYNIILYVSSIYEEGMVTVNYNYNPVGEIAVPNTRDVNVWYEIRIDNVYLDAGENMPLQIVNSSNVTWNLNWVDFQSSGAGGDVLTIDDLNLSVGESYTMYAYYSPSYNPAAITSWGSDNYMVATIDASGTVYAKSAGQAKITAFDETGASARATVFVTDGGGGGMIYTPEPTDRFATWVQNYSSQWGDPSWAAYQATGFPNSYPNYGDISSAWASSYPDNQREYIELGFDNPKPINYIKVFETYNPGSIDTIYAWNGNSWDILYQEPAAYVGEFSRILDIRFPTTSYDVSLVRLALNSPAVYGYNEIDAVAIGNTTPPQPFTVYYNNSAGWSNVGLWVWNDKTSTSLFGSWPGELMTYNDTTGWFSYEIPGEYTNVIFNNYDLTFNDGHQTADLYRNSTGWFDGRIWYDEMPVTIEQPEYAYKTGRIEAENYDAMGGSLPGWDGSTGVVLEECYDVGGGFDVGYIDRFDWMEYAVNIPQEGDYYLNLRVANYENYNASVQVLIDGVLIGDVRTYIPVTNGWQNFETMAQYYYLPAGNHVLTLYCYDGSWNINWLEISTEDLSTSATSGWEKLKANWTIQDNSTRITGLVATQNPNTYGNWTCDESSYTLSWIGDSVLDVYCNRSDDELMWTGFKFNLGNISYGENYSAMSDDIYTGYTLDLSQKPKITIKVKNTGTDYIDLRLDLIDVNGHASNYSSYFAYTYPEESDFVYYEFTVYPDYLLDQWSPEWWEQNNNREVWDPNFTDLIPVDMTKIAQLYFMINPGNGYVNANLQITDLWLGTVVKDPPAEYVDLYTEEITLGVNEAYALEQHKDFYVYPENADLSTIFAQSRDESVATFSQGLISANGEGSTYIVFTPEKAYSEYDIDSILVNVLPEGEYTAVKGVVIESDENTVFEQGSWYYLYAYVLPADATNPGIVWSSTNEDVIYFDEWGNMYANSPGTCTIRASSSVNSTIFDEMTVTVSPVQIWLLELYPEYTTIASNSTFYPEVYYEPSYIADAKFIWTSS
ncbi:MAG: carbohydrate-binding protein, partial [Bacteroidales bacterium]|nr:carbohydrate-binding protein [Bacteroidales bacterium]